MKGPVRPQMMQTGAPLPARSAQGATTVGPWVDSGEHDFGRVGFSIRSGED